jgi:hypothetical protein
MAAENESGFTLPRKLVDFILLGPVEDQRQLQDSPLQGDVWLAYGKNPKVPQDLLITPHWDATASHVAKAIAEGRKAMHASSGTRLPIDARIAYLQGLVAAKLTFTEALRIVVPMTAWWCAKGVGVILEEGDLRKQIVDGLIAVLNAYQARESDESFGWRDLTIYQRFAALAALILWCEQFEGQTTSQRVGEDELLQNAEENANDIAQGLVEVCNDITADWKSGWAFEFFKLKEATNSRSTARATAARKASRDEEGGPDKTASAAPCPGLTGLVFQVSLNRRTSTALSRSVPAVKGDAARMLFKINCDNVTWAVLDAGIDREHPALRDSRGKSRVVKTFDFTRVRDIVSRPTGKPDSAERKAELTKGTKLSREKAKAGKYLRQLVEDADAERPFNWAIIEQFVTLEEPEQPKNMHGTHVAGIIGARDEEAGAHGGGMCPDIKLYDFQVLGPTLRDTEFAVIAALQYLRYVNERHNYTTIHGANLSLSIPHSVRNFACGRTPVCEECERAVESGIVVVAAAGNRGYQHFETADGVFENYAAFSITDPGNADGVITVGSTHRNWPHTYGVSFFSSRGPTGDGRVKPDLVAPGERIESLKPGGEWGTESGTSMAAPHVSGAAAMLMARYPELVGRPRRIKQILCDTATDLGRERSFQGRGMLDVLRALQSI